MERTDVHSKTSRILFVTAMCLSFTLVLGTRDVRAQGPLARPQTWVDDELFDGVVTSTSFEPSAGLFDELYMGGDGFLDGVPLISDAGPRDTDYNGGRWHVNVLKEGVDPDKYVNASSVVDLDLGDFMSTPIHFECPLLPRRGGR